MSEHLENLGFVARIFWVIRFCIQNIMGNYVKMSEYLSNEVSEYIQGN